MAARELESKLPVANPIAPFSSSHTYVGSQRGAFLDPEQACSGLKLAGSSPSSWYGCCEARPREIGIWTVLERPLIPNHLLPFRM